MQQPLIHIEKQEDHLVLFIRFQVAQANLADAPQLFH
jgi:hypothetical protein